MKIQSKEKMLKKIENGRYFIAKSYEPDIDNNGIYKWYICSGRAQNMTFVPITEERAKEWLDLGAELLTF